MKRVSSTPLALFLLALAAVWLAARATGKQRLASLSPEQPPPRTDNFLPAPLGDDWTRWIVGQWEGSGQSNAGRGHGRARIELALNDQFLVFRSEAQITEMAPEQVEYLKKHMHASDAEIQRFRSQPYQALELYTVDQTTGEVIGFVFDSLRCIATGRGNRDGNKETIHWRWATGHKSTRITEKVALDKLVIVERTDMPDGTVMEDKSEMTRRPERVHGAKLF